MRRGLTLILLGVINLLLVSAAQAQTTFRWKFAPDQLFELVCTQQTEIETSINNKPRRALLEMSMDLAWQVEEVNDDGVATIRQSFTRLSLKTTPPDADPVVYDSASLAKPSGTAKEIAAGVAPLLDAKFIVKIDARGEVLEVALTEAAQKSLAALPEGSQLQQLLSADGLAQLVRLGAGQLPEKPVSPGDTWPAESSTQTPYGQLAQTGTFTYVGPQNVAGGKLQRIDLSSTARLQPQADAALQLVVQEQTKTGVLLFDTEAGQAVSSETKLLSKSLRPFRDTQIHVKIQGTTKLEIKAK